MVGIDSNKKPNWLLATLRGMRRRLSTALGVISAVTVAALQLVELGTEKGWHFRVHGWPRPDLLVNWQRNLAEINPQDWPSVCVILATGVFAGLGAAFAISAVRQTFTTINQRFNTTYKIMTSPPTDVVRADKETRDWVNGLSAKESEEQQKEIFRLLNECSELKREREALTVRAAQLDAKLKQAGDRLKANERVFSQFEKLSRAMQSRIDRARQRYPV